MNRDYFDESSRGERMEYELIVHPGVPNLTEEFKFGFASGENALFAFTGVNGKLYDEDGKFFGSYLPNSGAPFEIYGNVYDDYHNYSINRIPVNLDCGKLTGTYIDNFFYDHDDFKFNLRVKTSVENLV